MKNRKYFYTIIGCLLLNISLINTVFARYHADLHNDTHLIVYIWNSHDVEAYKNDPSFFPGFPINPRTHLINYAGTQYYPTSGGKMTVMYEMDSLQDKTSRKFYAELDVSSQSQYKQDDIMIKVDIKMDASNQLYFIINGERYNPTIVSLDEEIKNEDSYNHAYNALRRIETTKSAIQKRIDAFQSLGFKFDSLVGFV